MPAKVLEVKLLGDKELEMKLNSMVPKLQKKVLRPALRKVAKKIVLPQVRKNLASIRVTGKHTIPLSKNLRVAAVRRSRKSFGVVIKTPERDKLGIKGRHYYPSAIEFGTRKVPAKPYLRSAIPQTKDEAFALLRKEVTTGLKKINE